jgi:2-phospho-L-lactate guanylyltransferase (CobY/MobA/RfbA family)
MPLYWTKGMTFCPSTVSSALSRLSNFFSRPTRRRAFKMARDLIQSTSGMIGITVLLAWLGWMMVTWWA